MVAVIQRVKRASVSVDSLECSKIQKGLLVLLGVRKEDDEKTADRMAKKICAMRIFEDENGKMNLSLNDVGGDMIVVSNFTLCANYSHGNRPDFFMAESPDRANELYEYFCARSEEYLGKKIGRGIFGADMKIDMEAYGPVTISMDSELLGK